MPRYVVSYDLLGEEGERNNDYSELDRKLGADPFNAKRLLHSVWGLSSNSTLDSLYSDIFTISEFRINDRLVVVQIDDIIAHKPINKASSF